MTTETTTETSSEDVSGLKNNNAALKRERDEWKRKHEEAQKLLDDAEDNAAASDELSKLKREYNKLEKSYNDTVAERDTFASELKSTRVDSAISAAIASGNVLPHMVEAVESIMHRKVQYEDGEATINGKSIADFAKGYFIKDGAHFVRPADNAGADATGAAAKSKAPREFNETEYSIQRKTDPAGAEAWARETNNTWILPKTV